MNYSQIDKPEIIPGVKKWTNPKNGFTVFMLHYTADPDKDPKRRGREWHEKERKGTLKATWEKEYEIDFSTKSGKLIFGPEFCDFDPKIHFINSFEIPEPYEQLISLDFGQRNPTCGLIGVYTPQNILYIVDEYYKPAIPSVSSREMFEQFQPYLNSNIEGKSFREKRMIVQNSFSIKVIDPTTVSKNRTKIIQGEEIEYSVIEEFYDHGWEFDPGNNNVSAAITRIREYLQLDENKKSHLYIFKDKCPYLCYEMERYRYKEYTEVQEKNRNLSEDPVKKDDHAVDALKYMIMTRPASPQKVAKPLTRIQKDIRSLLKPKVYNDWDIN